MTASHAPSTSLRFTLANTPPNWRPSIVSAIFACALYAVTICGSYVYDDVARVHDDPRYASPAQWGKLWTEAYALDSIDNLYRPLTSTTYAIEWWLHGDRSWAFHLVNILLNALAAGLVAEFARRLTNSRVAYLAGLLFAVHPIHVEAAANIVGRAELLCTIGTIGALVLFLRRPVTFGRALAITLCYLLALLSKEQGILLPLLLLIVSWLRKRGEKGTRPPGERPALLLLAVMCVWISAGYLLYREHILPMAWDRNQLDWTINPMIRSQGIHRWLMPLVLLGHYAQLMAVPLKLSPDYGALVLGAVVDRHDPYLYFGLLIAVTWVVTLILAIRRHWDVVTFCLLGLGLTYGMVSNFGIIIGTNLAERLMYLPSAFALILVSLLLARIRGRVLLPIFAIILALASARTATYAWRWNDRLRLYSSSLAENPKSIRLHMLKAYELMEQRHYAESEEILAEARQMLPEYYSLWMQSALLAERQQHWDQASHYLDEAIKRMINPTVAILQKENLSQLREASTKPATTESH
jgi:hypothetical protein